MAKIDDSSQHTAFPPTHPTASLYFVLSSPVNFGPG